MYVLCLGLGYRAIVVEERYSAMDESASVYSIRRFTDLEITTT